MSSHQAQAFADMWEDAEPPLVSYLRYEDWMPYIEPAIEDMGAEVHAYLVRQAQLQVGRRIRKVNQLYRAMKDVYPEGNPLFFCVALEKFAKTDEQIIDALKDQEFIRQICQECQRRGIMPLEEMSEMRQEPASGGEMLVSSESDSDNDYDDDSDVSDRKRRSPKRWSEHEIEEFKALIEDAPKKGINNWKQVAKRFPGTTPDQCRNLYHRLHKKNELTAVFRQRKSAHKLGRPTKVTKEENEWCRALHKQVKHIARLTFRYKNKLGLVGPESEKLKNVASDNPFMNYIDIITEKTIQFPAISPEGHLLDLTTFKTAASNGGINPVTGAKFKLRQVTLLTWDNVHEWLPKIKNLEESRPKDPNDDQLRFLIERDRSDCGNMDVDTHMDVY